MSKRKFYSVAGGPWLFGLFTISFIVAFLSTICFPKIIEDTWTKSWFPWVILIVGLIVLRFFLSFGFLNSLVFSDKEMHHKSRIYNWEHICITVIYTTGCCFVFSEKFLNSIEAKQLCKKGLFLIVKNKKRLEYLLNIYQNQIYIPESFVDREKVVFKGQFTFTLKEIIDRIESHNHTIKLIQAKTMPNVAEEGNS